MLKALISIAIPLLIWSLINIVWIALTNEYYIERELMLKIRFKSSSEDVRAAILATGKWQRVSFWRYLFFWANQRSR